MDTNYEEQIRNRKSYQYFKEILGKLKTGEISNPIEILRLIYQAIDTHQGFQSMRNAGFALESLNLIELEELSQEV